MPKSTLFDSRIKKYAYYEAEEIYREIGVSKDGLSQRQVEAMREKYGGNSFTERRNDTVIRRLNRALTKVIDLFISQAAITGESAVLEKTAIRSVITARKLYPSLKI